jgi:hypothetical protein
VLDELQKHGVKIDGIAIRDTNSAVAAFLKRHGNPYERIGSDPTSRVQLALGSAGVPETFIIDGRGVIRLQHVGPIEHDDIPRVLAAEIFRAGDERTRSLTHNNAREDVPYLRFRGWRKRAEKREMRRHLVALHRIMSAPKVAEPSVVGGAELRCYDQRTS